MYKAEVLVNLETGKKMQVTLTLNLTLNLKFISLYIEKIKCISPACHISLALPTFAYSRAGITKYEVKESMTAVRMHIEVYIVEVIIGILKWLKLFSKA